MSMTVEEAKYTIMEYKPIMGFARYREALDVAISALEEVQKLHEIGTVSEFQQLKEKATAIREQAITEFEEKMNARITEFVLEHQEQLNFVSGVGMGWKFVDEIATELKGE